MREVSRVFVKMAEIHPAFIASHFMGITHNDFVDNDYHKR